MVGLLVTMATVAAVLWALGLGDLPPVIGAVLAIPFYLAARYGLGGE